MMHVLYHCSSASEDKEMHVPTLVTTFRQPGMRGRPRKDINLQWLHNATKGTRSLSYKDISEALGIHRHTLRTALRRIGLQRQSLTVSDSELDRIARKFRREKPTAGYRYLIGHLRKKGIRVPIAKVMSSLRRVDPVRQLLQSRKTIRRRRYRNRGPNRVWHLDGHHKLIRWGVVIHGFIDGYDRLVSSNLSLHNSILPIY